MLMWILFLGMLMWLVVFIIGSILILVNDVCCWFWLLNGLICISWWVFCLIDNVLQVNGVCMVNVVFLMLVFLVQEVLNILMGYLCCLVQWIYICISILVQFVVFILFVLDWMVISVLCLLYFFDSRVCILVVLMLVCNDLSFVLVLVMVLVVVVFVFLVVSLQSIGRLFRWCFSFLMCCSFFWVCDNLLVICCVWVWLFYKCGLDVLCLSFLMLLCRFLMLSICFIVVRVQFKVVMLV